MPFLLAVDTASLTLCFVLCAALVLLVGAADIRRPVSRAFMVFALLECGWSVTSLLLRLSLWFATGSPLVLLVLASMFLAVMGPVLLLFAERYLQVHSRWPLIVVLIVAVAQIANVPWLLDGRFLSDPALRANGMVVYHFTPLGLAVALIPAACMALALVLFVTAPRRRGELPIAVSIAFVLAGYLLGGILEIHAPVMSVTLTAEGRFPRLGHRAPPASQPSAGPHHRPAGALRTARSWSPRSAAARRCSWASTSCSPRRRSSSRTPSTTSR